MFCHKCGTTLQKAGPATSAAAPAYPAATQYAGFWRRFAASLIDGLIIAPVSFVIQLAFGVSSLSGNLATQREEPGWLARYIIANALVIVLGWLYYAAMESSTRQATLGKMALGVVVTDIDGRRVSFARATGRYFGKWLSSLILCIGFLMIAFTEKKQGLHDMMAKCLVVVKK